MPNRTQTGSAKLEVAVPMLAPNVVPAVGNEESTVPNDNSIEDKGQVEVSRDDFLAERTRYIDARQRAQQRIDQLVTSGSAGALVLSITFIHEIAPSPTKQSAVLLFLAWLCLITALGGTLIHHHVSQRAFEDYVAELDRAYTAGDSCDPRSQASTWGERLAIGSSAALVLGVLFLAAFAFLNLTFT